MASVTERTVSPRVILITGCSSGFGLSTAVRLASHGHTVYATMRNLDKRGELEAAAAERNAPLSLLELDVTKRETIERVCTEISERHGRLDLLVNNAGFGLGGFFADISEEEYREQFETNFFGLLAVTRAALPLLLCSPAGKVINISSISGLTALPGVGPYHSSKWAVEGFSESLRLELLPVGVQVCLIEPGSYPTKALTENTRFAANARRDDGPFAPFAHRVVELFESRNADLRGDVEQIARRIERIMLAKRPRFRHLIGDGAKSMYYLRRILPYPLYERILSTYLFGGMDASR